MQKLIRIFGAEFKSMESKAFSYRIDKNYKTANGLLFSNDATVSLSFESNMSLVTNQMEFAYRNEALTVPPSKRAIKVDQDLTDCQVISGTIENLKIIQQDNAKRTINIYLLVERNED